MSIELHTPIPQPLAGSAPVTGTPAIGAPRGADDRTCTLQDSLAAEKALFHDAHFRQALKARLIVLLVSVAIAAVDYVSDVLAAPWQLILCFPIVTLLVHGAAHLLHERSRVTSGDFWNLLLFDVFMIGGNVAVLGVHGYLGLPFYLVAASAYALGLPRPGRRLLMVACLVYPVARIAGMAWFGDGLSWSMVLLETACMGGLGWVAIQGPTRHTYRVRRARRALGALERGDFSVRLPTRALDDLGFLAVSFNRSAEALGRSVQALRAEIDERTRAESARRTSEARLTVAEREARHMAARMRALADVASGVLGADSEDALQVVLRTACEAVLPLDVFTFGLYVDREHALRFLHDPVLGEAPATITLTGRPSDRVVRERRSLVTLSADDPASRGSVPFAATARSESVIRTPILAGDQVLGVISVQSYTRDAYDAGDVEVLEAVAALAATALRNIRLVEELRGSQSELARQAFNDSLTGLANRPRFRERLARALETANAAGRPDRVAVLLLDLDGFKRVNDSLGHAAGDRLLVEVAGRLLDATRGRDTVARLGGDEFVILIENVRSEQDAVTVAERILRSLEAPIRVDGTQMIVGASIGIARGGVLVDPATAAGATPEPATHAAPPDGASHAPLDAQLDAQLDALLRDADVAMYRAKGAGKRQFVVFQPAMHAEVVQRLLLEADLQVAVERDQLRVHYQPIVALDGGRVVGVEALVRWEHPTRGLVSPADFVPIAEETGMIVPLGRWVLREACRQAATWQRLQRERGETLPLTVTVNVSGHQLEHPDFRDDVRMAIAESGLAAGTLVLEMTESTIIEHPLQMRERLVALKALGVRLAIDDFGTGYSALSYLRQFPVDVLKIDRSFVERVTRGGADAALARAVVGLGEALSLRCIAEGVEGSDQQACLQGIGCEYGQGYLFSRPVPAVALTALLDAEADAAARPHVPRQGALAVC